MDVSSPLFFWSQHIADMARARPKCWWKTRRMAFSSTSNGSGFQCEPREDSISWRAGVSRSSLTVRDLWYLPL